MLCQSTSLRKKPKIFKIKTSAGQNFDIARDSADDRALEASSDDTNSFLPLQNRLFSTFQALGHLLALSVKLGKRRFARIWRAIARLVNSFKARLAATSVSAVLIGWSASSRSVFLFFLHLSDYPISPEYLKQVNSC
ncbi:hypothetical protein TNCT_500651 [Trichonephila clavata]|uniref:Uncharacterized protein n=1 Tax=Trichonephila clavata TaxID=2740835 RepID=A0A8X6HKC2_TRICU|nr:hypothetical protein TNCT_500651 [Trichonephila clavata]